MDQDRLFDSPWHCLKVARDGPIVVVTLNRPEARNSLNLLLVRELTEVAGLLHRRSDVLAVILTGGASFFSAGADLSDPPSSAQGDATLLQRREAVMAGPDLCQAWEAIEAVTIAAIEGYCIGGACALATVCDFRVMGEGAYLRLPEIPLGLNMSWRAIPRIVSLIGPARTKRFVMFGESASAATCLDWGFADETTPAGEALAAARRWAERVAALPPLPVRMTKEAVNAAAGAHHHAVSFMDRDQYLLTAQTADFREGVAAFFEKRPPAFRGD